MIFAAYLLSVSGMIILPTVLAFYLPRGNSAFPGNLYLAGRLTFIASKSYIFRFLWADGAI